MQKNARNSLVATWMSEQQIRIRVLGNNVLAETRAEGMTEQSRRHVQERRGGQDINYIIPRYASLCNLAPTTTRIACWATEMLQFHSTYLERKSQELLYDSVFIPGGQAKTGAGGDTPLASMDSFKFGATTIG